MLIDVVNLGPRLSTEAFILGALHDPSPLIRYKGPEEGSEASLIKELRSVLAKAGDRPIWTWHSALKFEHVLGRLENLATTKDAQPSDQSSNDTAILGWLLQSILSYPRDGVATSDISLRILYIAARRVLNELPRPSTPPELENDSEMALHWLRHDSGRDLDNDPVFIESCDFCGSQIGLTKSAQAYCTGEIPHFFGRTLVIVPAASTNTDIRPMFPYLSCYPSTWHNKVLRHLWKTIPYRCNLDSSREEHGYRVRPPHGGSI